MVYIDDWDEFYAKSKSLYLAFPYETRYTYKFRHADNDLVLKVTNNAVCLKYKTDEQKDLKKLEAMDALMFRLMSANSVTDASTSMDLTGDDDEKTNRSRSNTQTNQDNNKKKQGKRRRKNKGGI